MKVKTAAYLLISICMIGNTANAYTVDDESILHKTDENKTYINGTLSNEFKNVRYVGNGYIAGKYEENGEYKQFFTEDFENYRQIRLYEDDALDPYSRAGHMDEIIWAGGMYIARSNVYDIIGTFRGIYENTGYLYVLDINFNLLKRIEFERYIREISYVYGKYYIRISNDAAIYARIDRDNIDKVYYSDDLENWKERPDLQHVPMSNGNVSIIRKGYEMFTFVNDLMKNRIEYEEIKLDQLMTNPQHITYDNSVLNILNLMGKYFYIPCYGMNDYVWLSEDGICFTKYRTNTHYLQMGVDCIEDKYSDIYIKTSDIDRYMQTGNVYVKLNGCILGFATPPVTENDRTLVPMRFLFEQMGAEVDWDEATQTATAVAAEDEGRAARTVSFSINNTNASVNGAQKTMDVPARLINDKTMIPLRFLSENLGYSVEWDEETRTAVITG